MKRYPLGQAVTISVEWRSPDSGDPVDPTHVWFEMYGPRAVSPTTYEFQATDDIQNPEPGSYEITLPGTPVGDYSGRFFCTGEAIGAELAYWKIVNHGPQ